MLHDEHAHRGDPHHDDRAEILDTRQLQTEHLLTAHGQLVAMVEQVGGEEERKEQLGELAGWNWPSPGILIQMRAPFTS